MGKLLSYYEPARGSTRTSNIKRNNNYFDPSWILNGTASVDGATATIEASNFLMYSSGDPSYVANQKDVGVNMGKAAAGNVFVIFPNLSTNTVIVGSDTSMPASIQRGWRYYLPLTGAWDASNWLLSVILFTPSTGNVNVQVGVRLWYGSNASVIDGSYLKAFSTDTPQYGPVVSFQLGAAGSQNIVFSISVSGSGPEGGAGLGGPFILSGQYFYEEWFMQVVTASNKTGTQVLMRTDG